MTRLAFTHFMRAASLTPLAVGIAALVACSERPTAPSLTATGASFDRGDTDGAAPAAATLAWEKATRDLVASHSMMPIVATRLYALHSMAQYAAVAAVSRGRDDDDRDGGGRAISEARRGAIAGASVQLLSALVADAAPALEARLAAFGTDASGRTHPQFTRGVAIGRAAGNVMIAWAAKDGFAKPWNESMRNASGVGIWEGALAPNAGTARPAPTGYQYPTMTPYFLTALNGKTAQSQFRAPPPPPYSVDPQSRFQIDLAEVKAISINRGKTPIDVVTQQQIDLANFWNLAAGTPTTLGHWNEQVALLIAERGLGDRAASHLFALLNAAAFDATIGCWESKYTYLLLRPTMADHAITTVYPLPNHPSYPSGHSCLSSTAATVLSRYFPAHAPQLSADMIDAGLSRIYGGIHYRFDIEAGQALGRSTAEWAMAYDREHGVLAAIGLGVRGEDEHARHLRR